MYVCGVTVYDYCHLGHARSALVFDMIRRYLEYSGYTVKFVKNFTDVDDKIIKRANEQGVSCEEITFKYIQAYYEDMGKLGIRQASIEPKATDHMTDIIHLTERLVKKGRRRAAIPRRAVPHLPQNCASCADRLPQLGQDSNCPETAIAAPTIRAP